MLLDKIADDEHEDEQSSSDQRQDQGQAPSTSRLVVNDWLADFFCIKTHLSL